MSRGGGGFYPKGARDRWLEAKPVRSRPPVPGWSRGAAPVRPRDPVPDGLSDGLRNLAWGRSRDPVLSRWPGAAANCTPKVLPGGGER
ncbi:hypothetical protein ThesuDRAFT_01416 [Thermaerobacter subterraneus DSM 13965]|uniref:Uncharacterized protein n=1 Tax=Thermaerobacter subterraneus DSM 13965 TaxID=867903 RepID=K6PRS6_9FIRM|nr:hypothetical protein ThesuDRAFT_01416 [Thermaerobacter subterraneus DSM 13965]